MMKDFGDLHGADYFMREGLCVLTSTLNDFFSASVGYYFRPISELFKLNIDITVSPKRNVYVYNQDTVILLCSVRFKEDDYYLGIKLYAKGAGGLTKIYNMMAQAIGTSLRDCVQDRFSDAIVLLGDRLVVRLISSYFRKMNYSPAKVTYIIEKFLTLRSTTFEGKHFSTGVLLTNSFHEYKNPGEEGRMGRLLKLNKSSRVLSPVDNRYWYLVDGFRSFYITDLVDDIREMFIYTDPEKDHLKNTMLYKTLRGGDVLIRTEAGRDVSIITSRGEEFINQENRWRYRDYELLKQRIVNEIPLNDDVYNSLLYYVLYCSKNDTSALLWIPKDMSKFADALKIETINRLTRRSINISDQSYSSLIKRLISSDGATVINSVGDVVAFGCMVDMKDAKPHGVKGTGESAAGILAKNGIAIKVSQDGTIKIFFNGRDRALKF